jgi:hypothetical protein
MPARHPRPNPLSPTTIARRNAIFKGLLGGSRGWMYVGGALWVLRLTRRTFGKNEVIVATEVMQPGQSLILRTIRPSRAERRTARGKR